MRVTCVLVSHNKAKWCKDAVESVLGQTHSDTTLLVVDSGILHSKGYFDKWHSNKLFVIKSNETEEDRSTKCLQGWCINQVLRRSPTSLQGLLCYLSDDDIYHRNVFSEMSDRAHERPWEWAWYGSCELWKSDREKYGTLEASEPGDLHHSLRGRVDGMQVFHRHGIPVEWPEEYEVRDLADGVFLDRLSRLVTVHPVGVCVGKHRHTPESTFTKDVDIPGSPPYLTTRK